MTIMSFSKLFFQRYSPEFHENPRHRDDYSEPGLKTESSHLHTSQMQKVRMTPTPDNNIQQHAYELTMVKRNSQFGTNAETLWTAEATNKVTAAAA
jgi:hypothetical protein